MAFTQWEPTTVKAQLRLTSLRLGQLQEKKDSLGNITRKDIATLLQQRNIGLARTKAQKLMEEDAMADLLEMLEMYVGLILEHLTELDENDTLSPPMVEATSSIIFAAPTINSKDLSIVRDLLVQRLGPDFARSANGNYDNHVPSSVIQAVHFPTPTAAALDNYLEEIARSHAVEWFSQPRRETILNIISEILDPTTLPIVDLPKLRRLCARGIPDEPCWLRPRIWKLFLGILPTVKASWKSEIYKQRESYYNLVRRLLGPLSNLPPPSIPLAPIDATLLNISKQLSGIPLNMIHDLGDEREPSPHCPLDDIALDEIKISCARNLDVRLKALQGPELPEPPFVTPEIRLEPDHDNTLAISSSSTDVENAHNETTTLIPSGERKTRNHLTVLLRLLYLHTSINPGNQTPHIPSLLVPIYITLSQEVDLEDLAHVEADTFWLFEAIIGEFSELGDEEDGNIWMKKLSQRLAWADVELSENLQAMGLDPALPHYSYRWLVPLLTHTMPLGSIFPVWDALFSCQLRDRATNHKLDHLLDICTAMLIHVRKPLFRLGKGDIKSPGLWIEENNVIPPQPPARDWEVGNPFLEGISLLHHFPIKEAGGIDRILQTASDLSFQRGEETKSRKDDKVGLGARLKATMWKGFTNQVSSPDTSPVDSEEELSDDVSLEDGNDTETQEKNKEPGLTSRLAITVWRGITNQASMESPPSPIWPVPRSYHAPPTPTGGTEEKIDSHHGSSQESSSLRAYAEKLKDSDTAAVIAKVSTNWRAKALMGAWGRVVSPRQDIQATPPLLAPKEGTSSDGYGFRLDKERRGSLPSMDRTGVYSPPAQSLRFRSPRDSLIFPGRNPLPVATEQHPESDEGILTNLPTSLASLTRSRNTQAIPKSAPRPLLLSTTTSITPPPGRTLLRTNHSAPIPGHSDWADVMRTKGHNIHRDSLSSVSSLSPSDALSRPSKSGWDSDNGRSSRFIPLNRRSVSPMAPGFRVHQERPASVSSSAASSDRGLRSPPLLAVDNARTKLQKLAIDPTLTPPPVSSTAPRTFASDNDRSLVNPEQRSSSEILDQELLQSVLHPKFFSRNRTPPSSRSDDTSDSSVVEAFPKSPRLRSKRYLTRPPDLSIQGTITSLPATERKFSNPNSLVVDWPSEDHDIIITPRASAFPVEELTNTQSSPLRSARRLRKASAETHERFKKSPIDNHDIRSRKFSAGQRTRKISNESKVEKRVKDSSVDSSAEGDDEGYDDLLSAYESEGDSSLQ